MKSKVK